MPAKATTLAQRIEQASETGRSIEQALKTNERVLARITDGIYRQPSSALRELISNAYDADAREVAIVTDAPRFSSIIVRDDGIGFSPRTLAHMVENIGGSAKRTGEGADLEITEKNDPTHSPGGRQLIGKLGIGLFSVAQFTRHFLIITKTKGDKYRTIADITIGPVEGAQRLLNIEATGEIERGRARIRRERIPASEVETHGTEIRLLDLLKRTRDELASLDRWAKLDYEMETEGRYLTPKPRLHIGRESRRNPGELSEQPVVPWMDDDPPENRFRKLVEAVRGYAEQEKELVDLDSVCDRYLQTLWTLALSAPLPYLDGHPFDLGNDDGVLFFQVENRSRGQATKLNIAAGQTPRKVLKLRTPEKPRGDSFAVEVDGVRLFRPLLFRNQPKTTTAVKTPLLFVGRDRQEFTGKPVELSGGPLEFEAYLFWTPKVLPTQHQGVMLRVGDASGAPFDRTFVGYQVSEQVRLRQMTVEIFVREGLDGALNLDRESYNFAHPHYQYIVKWLHSAIRQLTNRHKELGGTLRTTNLAYESRKAQAALARRVVELLKERGIEDVPEVVLLDSGNKTNAARLRREGCVVMSKDAVVPVSAADRKTTKGAERAVIAEKKAIAIAQILHAWGVMDELDYEEQEKLVRDLAEVALMEGLA